MKITLTILTAFIINSGTIVETGDADWVLEKDKNNIKIWTRESQSRSIKSFKATAIIEASSEQVAAVLNDIDAYPEWMADLESTRVLNKISETECYYYFEVDAPWPVSNRDNVAHFILENDSETRGYKVTVTGHADYIPEKEDIVRIPESHGIWKIIPLSSRESKIIFEYTADPGGKLPAWAVNMFIVDGPFKTLSNLKEFVKQGKYN